MDNSSGQAILESMILLCIISCLNKDLKKQKQRIARLEERLDALLQKDNDS